MEGQNGRSKLEENINFLSLKKYTVWLSGFFLMVGLILYVTKGGFRYGIDFGGGSQVRIKVGEDVSVEELKEKMGGLKDEMKIIELEDEEGSFLIRTYIEEEVDGGFIEKLVEAEYVNRLKEEFAGIKIEGLEYEGDGVRFQLKHNGIEIKKVKELLGEGVKVEELGMNELGIWSAKNELILREEVIKPLSAGFKGLEIEGVTSYSSTQGSVLKEQAFLVSLLVLVLILIYIGVRFRLSFGVASIAALVHDILIVLTFLLIFDREIEVIVVVSILTIIGYSLNDTIVIFDRIRENSQILTTKQYDLLINRSIHQSLRRTLVTSLTTLLVVICIWIWGGPTLENLAFTLIIGVIVGTYSSIFIASPVLMLWEDWQRSKKLKMRESNG